jgi:hypothetical protein
MTDSSQTGAHAGSESPRAAGSAGREGAAPRLNASVVPSITGVSILPGNAPARLMNISWSGALLECGRRLKPGSDVTILFAGTFQPAQVPSRVARVNVCGIGPTGALTFQIGLAFSAPITLPDPRMDREPAPPTAWPAAPAAQDPTSPSVLRNRW